MPCGGGGVLRRILVLLSCRAAGCMRVRGRGRTFVLVARAAGNCARRIDEGSLWNPPASGGVWCFVPESDRREVECVVVIMVACAVWRHGWFGVRPLVFMLSACSDR